MQKLIPQLWRGCLYAAAVVILTCLVLHLYFGTHRVSNAEGRRRMLREIDRSNAESGFIRGTNDGDFVYVGVTNALIWWTNQGLAR